MEWMHPPQVVAALGNSRAGRARTGDWWVSLGVLDCKWLWTLDLKVKCCGGRSCARPDGCGRLWLFVVVWEVDRPKSAPSGHRLRPGGQAGPSGVRQAGIGA